MGGIPWWSGALCWFGEDRTAKSVVVLSTETETFRLSPEAATAVQSLAAKQGVSHGEAIRRALSTELFLMQRRAAGDLVLLRRRDGSYHEVMPLR